MGSFKYPGRLGASEYAIYLSKCRVGSFKYPGRLGASEYAIYLSRCSVGSFKYPGRLGASEYAIYLSRCRVGSFKYPGRLRASEYLPSAPQWVCTKIFIVHGCSISHRCRCMKEIAIVVTGITVESVIRCDIGTSGVLTRR